MVRKSFVVRLTSKNELKFYNERIGIKTGHHVKEHIEDRWDIPIDRQVLKIGSRTIDDGDHLSYVGVSNNAVIHLFITSVQYDTVLMTFDANDFDFEYNKSYNDSIPHDAHYRGGFIYHKPRGYSRFGLRVVGKYRDGDGWLCEEDPLKQWPVAYIVDPIVDEAFGRQDTALSMGYPLPREQRIIRSYPKFDYAERRARTIPLGNRERSIKVLYQCRVNPSTVERRHDPISDPSSPNEIWESSYPNDVRPYGILVKEFWPSRYYPTNLDMIARI